MCCGILFVTYAVVVILPSIFYLVPDVTLRLKTTTLLMFLVLHYGMGG